MLTGHDYNNGNITVQYLIFIFILIDLWGIDRHKNAPMRKQTIFLIICLSFLVTRTAHSLEDSECFNCHAEVDQKRFATSIHGKNLCTSCHSDITEAPHNQKPGPVKCGNCHRVEFQIYHNSDHGKAVAKGISEAASCKACHGDNHYLLNYRNPLSPVSRKNINQTCARCHEDEKKMDQYRLTQKTPYKSYLESVHGKAFLGGEEFAAVCTDCHGSHDLHSPNNPESKIYKFNVPKTCSKCHENVYNTYKMSIHAKALYDGVKDAPVCTDCHGEHDIVSISDPDSSVYAANIVKTCSHCHASEKITSKYNLPVDVLDSYMKSYHGIAYQYGSKFAANCASCHGFHDVLPSSDPRSSINAANVGRTCGKCHPGAGDQLSKGSVHMNPSVSKDVIVYYVSLFYIVTIVLTIGGMLFHNFLDIRKKLRSHYEKYVKNSVAVRLSRTERLQHLILVITFITLVYTGFAHKYPNAFYSYPFSGETGSLIRKVIHRVAGVIFIFLMLYQGGWLLFTKYGRQKILDLLPKWRDATDFFALLQYNIGWRKERPRFDRYNYIEKAEFWALIWGSVVMVLTGLILMFENISLSFMPKWLIDVALVVHFYEALLATLAIIVWHFYWVIFDPDVYPMNWSWVTGKITKHQLEEREEKKQ